MSWFPGHRSWFSCVFLLCYTHSNALLNLVQFRFFGHSSFLGFCNLIMGFGFLNVRIWELWIFVSFFLWFCIIHLFGETTVLMLIRIWFGFWFTLGILIVCHWLALYYNLTLLFSLMRIPVFRGGKTVRIRFRCMKLLDWDFASWNRVLGNYSICGRVFFF